MKRSRLFNLFFLSICAASIAHAQPTPSFRYSSVLNPVKTPGFYQVVLKPDIVAKCVDVSKDVRILNGKGQQVPFILQTDPHQYSQSNFISLPIISVSRQADKQTHVIIRNTINKTISRLLLVIKNTDASRSVTISGSDNNKQWFVIRENLDLNNLYSLDNDRSIQFVEFPSSSYKFFEIIIAGKDLLPVNIVEAGVYEEPVVQNKFLTIPAPAFFQRDSSNNISYVSIRFNESFLIHRLDLTLEGSKYFRRKLVVRNSMQQRRSWRNDYSLRSDAPLSFAVDIKAGQLYLEIYNEDNPPLKLTGISAYQRNIYLLAYLEPAGSYRLVFGDSLARAPSYDLEYFKDSLKNTALQVATGPIVDSYVDNPARQAPKTNTFILWIIIGVVLALLLALTLQLTREVTNKGKT